MDGQAYRPYRQIDRRKSRKIQVGSVAVGGDAPISVQTMTNTLTTDVAATLAQIEATPVVRCDEVAWSLIGISMAGWNALISLGLAVIWLRSFVKWR